MTGEKSIAALTQREFMTFSRVCNIMLKLEPNLIVCAGQKILCDSNRGHGFAEADISTLIKSSVEIAFKADKELVKELKNIKGASDISIIVNKEKNWISFVGPHYEVHLVKDENVHKQNAVCIPEMEVVGVPLEGHDPQALKGYIGNRSENVEIVIYDGQLEQIAVPGKPSPLTFTSGMMAHLRERTPDAIYNSSVAFSYVGKSNKISLMKYRDKYVLQTENIIDLKTNLLIYEVIAG